MHYTCALTSPPLPTPPTEKSISVDSIDLYLHNQFAYGTFYALGQMPAELGHSLFLAKQKEYAV